MSVSTGPTRVVGRTLRTLSLLEPISVVVLLGNLATRHDEAVTSALVPVASGPPTLLRLRGGRSRRGGVTA